HCGCLSCLFLSSRAALRVLHSFPTRRSSDLIAERQDRQIGALTVRPRPSHRDTGCWIRREPTAVVVVVQVPRVIQRDRLEEDAQDRKSTRLNSSHVKISYAVFCLKKKKKQKK